MFSCMISHIANKFMLRNISSAQMAVEQLLRISVSHSISTSDIPGTPSSSTPKISQRGFIASLVQ